MQTIKKGAKVAAGSLLFALMMLGLVMAPGFLSDRDSTTTHRTQEAKR